MENFTKISDNIFKCNTCGQDIPSGILNISGHWAECGGKEFYQGLINLATEKNGKLTIQDVDNLKKAYEK